LTILRAALCLAAGASLLAASSKPAGNQAADGAAAPASGPDVTITQADLPKLKPGLWATSVSENGQPATVSQHCETGEAVGMRDMSKQCSKFVFKRSFLGAINVDAVCGAGGYSSTMHMTVHGDFNSNIAGDAQITMTLPNHPPTSLTTHSESHYVGPCPAGASG
jgi:hypothetical protein